MQLIYGTRTISKTIQYDKMTAYELCEIIVAGNITLITGDNAWEVISRAEVIRRRDKARDIKLFETIIKILNKHTSFDPHNNVNNNAIIKCTDSLRGDLEMVKNSIGMEATK